MGIMEASMARENLYKNVYNEGCISQMCNNIAANINCSDYNYNMIGLSMVFNFDDKVDTPYSAIDSELRRVLAENNIECDEPGLLYNVTSIDVGDRKSSIILYL